MKYKLISAFTTNLVLLFLVHTTLAGSIKGNVHLEGSPSNANVLVYIEHVDSSFAAPQKHALMNQKDLMFIPEVLPVLTGTTVDFLNSDNVLHNVFTESKCAGNFNLGTWQKGQIRSYTFNKPDCFATILCDVHPDMQAWIAVLQNPYFSLTNKNGEYEIKNLPPGNYQLKVWSPFYKAETIDVVIKDNNPVIRNFTLTRTNE